MSTWLKRCGFAAILAALVGWPSLAWAQGCALCYTQAGGSGARMIAALRSGILILIVPPMLICVGISWMAYKKRNQFNEDLADEGPETNL
jgi:hypothetical protein